MTALAGLVPWAECVVGPDDAEAGVFARGAGIRLERDGGEAGDLGQPGFERAEQLGVAGGLLGRGVGVQLGELGPGDGQHLGGAVELHRAGAERDHGLAQRQVARFEALDVAQHLVLGVVKVEDRVREIVARAGKRGRVDDRRGTRELIHAGGDGALAGEDLPQGRHLGLGRGFIERNAQAAVAEVAQVDAMFGGPAKDGVGLALAQLDVQRVEEGLAADCAAEAAQAGGQEQGQAVDALGDAAQALRAMVDRVHAGHDGQQDLGGADVAGGLFAADVLLAGLEGEAERGLTVGVLRNTDQPAGHLAHVFGARGHERGVGAAKAQGHAEALGRADGDVGAELAGRA
jgi:hypothetical protein